VPAPPQLPLQFWGTPVTSDESPLINDTLFFDISNGYFNMNPLSYDLSYDIFFEETVSTYVTTIYPAGATPAPKAKRQSQLYVPAVCYDECNDAMLEAQQVGKQPSLCQPGSAFEVITSLCELCVHAHTADDTAGFVQVQPQFQQFLDYCVINGPPVSTAIESVTVVPESTTLYLDETVTLDSATYTFAIPTLTLANGYETLYPSSDVVFSTGTTVYPEPTFSSVSVVFVTSEVVNTVGVKSTAAVERRKPSPRYQRRSQR